MKKLICAALALAAMGGVAHAKAAEWEAVDKTLNTLIYAEKGEIVGTDSYESKTLGAQHLVYVKTPTDLYRCIDWGSKSQACLKLTHPDEAPGK